MQKVISDIEKKSLIIYWKEKDYENKLQDFSKQEIERKTVLHKLKEFYPLAEIKHTERGVPLVKNVPFSSISISHRRGWFALFLANKSIGIDIEIQSNNLAKGKFYFVNEKEEKIAEKEENLSIIWAAKEAIYKKYQGEILDLKEEVTILQIDKQHKEVTISYETTEKLVFLREKEMILVWTLL